MWTISSWPQCNLAKGWGLIQSGLRIGAPEPAGLYLGCKHVASTVPGVNGSPVSRLEYDMEDFMQSCVDRYVGLSGKNGLEKCCNTFHR